MPNRLAGETSPYLLQHAHNPVDWFPWGPDALAAAKLLDRPIFLSIGYAACHWCHVMERESFEHEPTARYLNDHFVAIKVDREERPDLDQVYMAAVQSMTGGGGWPMSVFLTPDGRPFYGGTYFPDEPRHGMPSFRQVLEGVERAWREQRDEVEAAGGRLVQDLVEQGRLDAGADDPTPALLDAATAGIEACFDTANGGWGRAPKFPQPMTIEFLLRRSVATGDDRPLAVARRSLDAMADGGLRDQLGGGFHRYSTDAVWLVPHFEQMLYDNAQLARVYLHAWALTGDARYRAVATGTLDYMLRELTTDDGAFAASQDADTDGIEGLTFTWRAPEIRDVLGDAAALFAAAYGVTDEGNWEGVTILSRVATDEALAGGSASRRPRSRRGSPTRGRACSRDAGSGRSRPATTRRWRPGTGWRSPPSPTARSSWAESDPHAADRYRAAADAPRRRSSRAAGGRRLARPVVEGRPGGGQRRARGLHAPRRRAAGAVRGDVRRALVRDRARVDGPGPRALRRSGRRLLRHRRRPRAARDAAQGRPGQRGPVGECDGGARPAPAGGLDRRGAYRDAAERAMRTVVPFVVRYPTGFAQWLWAMDLALAPAIEVAIVGEPDDPATAALVAEMRRGYRPEPGRVGGRRSGGERGPAAGRPGRARWARDRLCLPRVRLPPAGHRRRPRWPVSLPHPRPMAEPSAGGFTIRAVEARPAATVVLLRRGPTGSRRC